jgi:hypothetical protein
MSTWFATTTIEAIWASLGAWAATPALETINVAANKSLSGFMSGSNSVVLQRCAPHEADDRRSSREYLAPA